MMKPNGVSIIAVQIYSDGLLRAFVGNQMLFQIIKATYRELDDFGIPRVGKKNGWLRREWGWEIMAEMKFRKHKAGEK